MSLDQNQISTPINFFNQSNPRRELDMMKREISTIEMQIENLQIEVSNLSNIRQDLKHLLLDLEYVTGEKYITSQNENNTSIEFIHLLRKALEKLISLHNSLPERFETDFSKKAFDFDNELKSLQNEIEMNENLLSQYQQESQKLHRLVELNTKEKESLIIISESIQDSINQKRLERQSKALSMRDEINKLKQNYSTLLSSYNEQSKKNLKIQNRANAPTPKSILQMLSDDLDLNIELSDLQRRLDREINEHMSVKEELDHVYYEIKRAEDIILQFKEAYSGEEKAEAARINKKLRDILEKNRDEAPILIQRAIRKNKTLEKEIKELQEEESILKPYLASLEKKLSSQMLKLPSLAMLQHRGELSQKVSGKPAPKVRNTLPSMPLHKSFLPKNL